MVELLLALLLCTAANDSIFCDGFGDAMYISVDRPDPIVWAIDSTNHDAAIVTSSNYLTDGKVATPTRFTWDAGVQAYTVFTLFHGTFTGVNYARTDQIVIAFFCPNTPYALPVGARVLLQINDGTATPHVAINGDVVQFNNGGRGIVATGNPDMDFTAVSVDAVMYNSLNGTTTTWATAGQTFDLGEVWFGTLQEFKALTDPKYDLIDPTLMRRSHSNQPWPLFVKPYRQWTYNFAPMDTTKAFDSSSTNSFDMVRYQISQANCALFITRIYVQGTSTIDPLAIAQQTCFGKPDDVGAMTGVKEGMGIWAATAKIGEAPP
jgi:hypothetical protein